MESNEEKANDFRQIASNMMTVGNQQNDENVDGKAKRSVGGNLGEKNIGTENNSVVYANESNGACSSLEDGIVTDVEADVVVKRLSSGFNDGKTDANASTERTCDNSGKPSDSLVNMENESNGDKQVIGALSQLLDYGMSDSEDSESDSVTISETSETNSELSDEIVRKQEKIEPSNKPQETFRKNDSSSESSSYYDSDSSTDRFVRNSTG